MKRSRVGCLSLYHNNFTSAFFSYRAENQSLTVNQTKEIIQRAYENTK